MQTKQFVVTLIPEQREQLNRIIASNKTSIRQRTHARILRAADTNQPNGGSSDEEIAQQTRASLSTIARARRRFGEGGLEAALYHKQQQNRKPRALDGDAEAHLIAMVCAAPPDGHKRWTLRLLQDKMIERGYTDSVSHETVRSTLKKTNPSRG